MTRGCVVAPPQVVVVLPPYVPSSTEAFETSQAMAVESASRQRLRGAAASRAEATWIWSGGPDGAALVHELASTHLVRVRLSYILHIVSYT